MAVLNALYGITISVPTTPQPLLPLLQAIQSSLQAILQNVGTIQVQADQTNAGNFVLIGDSTLSVSPQQCAAKLSAGQAQYLYREGMGIPLSAVNIVASSSGCELNVLIVIM
jgi:hypothetical protein